MSDYVGPYSGEYYDNLSPDQGGWVPDYGGYDSGPSWGDLISQGINAARDAYVYGEQGYPSGPTNIYAPQYPQQSGPQIPAPLPYPAPAGLPMPVPQPSGGIQLSTTTLMLLVGGVLLFMLGTKKGR